MTLTRVDDDDVPQNLVGLGEDYLTVGNLNRVSYLRKYTAGGASSLASGAFPDQLIQVAIGFGNFVYAESESWDSGAMSLVIANATDLAEAGRVPLPSVPVHGSSFSMAVADGKIVIPVAAKGEGLDTQDSRLVIVDPNTRTSHDLDLGSLSPFLVRAVGDEVYVAHTYLNPAFGPLSAYRHVSVVNMPDESVKGYDLPDGISRMDVNNTTMAVLGEDADGNPVLSTYRTSDMSRQTRCQLTPPSSVPDAYAANVFLSSDPGSR